VPRVTIISQPPSESNTSSNSLDSKLLVKGTNFAFHVNMDPSKPTKVNTTNLTVSDLSTPQAPSTYVSPHLLQSEPSFTQDLTSVYRIAWTDSGGLMSRALHVERFHEILIRPHDTCHVRTWECMAGPLAYIIRAVLAKTLQQRFEDWCHDLKAHCEKLHATTSLPSPLV